MGFDFSDAYCNMTENCSAATSYLLQYLENKNIIGKFCIGTTVNSVLDGTGSVIYSARHNNSFRSSSYAHFSLKPQVFATESKSTNFSLEVLKYKNMVSGGGWLLSSDRTDDIIEIVYVRTTSESLQMKADNYLSGKLFSSEWGKKRATALALAANMRKEDIVEMDVILMDRKSILEWFSANGYPPDVMINEAKKIRQSGKKGKYPLGGFNRYDVQLNYNGRMPVNQAETVTLSTNVGFAIVSKWVVGHYRICRNSSGEVAVEEVIPFHFDWEKHGHGPRLARGGPIVRLYHAGTVF